MSKESLKEIAELIKYGIENRNWASVEEALYCLIDDDGEIILDDEDDLDEDDI